MSNFRYGVSIVQLDSDTYAFFGNSYNQKNSAGLDWGSSVRTFDIAVDGSTITQVGGFTFGGNSSTFSSAIKIKDDIVAVASNSGSRGKIDHIKISSDGTTISYVSELTYYNSASKYNSMIKMNSKDVYLVAHSDNSDKGYLQTFTMRTDLPYPVSYELSADNSKMKVTFSEAVFSTNGGSGELEVSDLNFNIVQMGGVKRLKSAVPTSISRSGNVYTLGIGLSGTPNGSETLTVVPTDNGIYDAAGNEASTSQSNNTATLNDKVVPTITGVALAANNATIAVTMSEAVFNTNGGSGNLEATDFSLSISGGNATLSSATPSSISISGNVYTLSLIHI